MVEAVILTIITDLVGFFVIFLVDCEVVLVLTSSLLFGSVLTLVTVINAWGEQVTTFSIEGVLHVELKDLGADHRQLGHRLEHIGRLSRVSVHIILQLEVDQIEIVGDAAIMLFALRGHRPGTDLSRVLFLFSASVELNARFAKTPSKHIEHFLELVIKEDLVELVQVHVLAPLRHQLLLLGLAHVLVHFIRETLLLEEVV